MMSMNANDKEKLVEVGRYRNLRFCIDETINPIGWLVLNKGVEGYWAVGKGSIIETSIPKPSRRSCTLHIFPNPACGECCLEMWDLYEHELRKRGWDHPGPMTQAQQMVNQERDRMVSAACAAIGHDPSKFESWESERDYLMHRIGMLEADVVRHRENRERLRDHQERLRKALKALAKEPALAADISEFIDRSKARSRDYQHRNR